MMHTQRNLPSLVARWAITVLLIVTSLARAAPPADLDAYAQHVLATFETAGMAVAIVERGQPTTIRTYGVRHAGQAAPVDGQTMFAIGSTSKAFTCAVLASLVDE